MSSHFGLFVDVMVSGVAHLSQLQKVTVVYKCTILLASFPYFVIKLSVGVTYDIASRSDNRHCASSRKL
jgi:hypothetical protein